MGLADACKDGRTRSVRVDGYVVVPRSNEPEIEASESKAGDSDGDEKASARAAPGTARRDARIEGAVLLKYPSTDPEGGARHYGFGAEAADAEAAVEQAAGAEAERVAQAVTRAKAAGVGTQGEEKELDTGDRLTDAQSRALANLGGAGGNGAGAAQSCAAGSKSPAWGIDAMPRGRSFHNHRFVAGLRRLAFRESNVRLCVGRAAEVVRAQS